MTLHVSSGGLVSSSTLRVRILSLQQSQTLSCCMVVNVVDHFNPQFPPGVAFLKLFDRRFAEEFRTSNTMDPWTERAEDLYIESVQSGRAHLFLDLLQSENGFKETEHEWTEADLETFLANELREQYDTEVATYNALGPYQGNLIPRLLATVNLDITPTHFRSPQPTDDHFLVKGLLLQYIPGFTLQNLAKFAPRGAWQNIVDQALNAVHMLHNNNILNKDVRLPNFMVSPLVNGGYQVYMIDFGLCILRRADHSDREWGQLKVYFDEEGCVGLKMGEKLAEEGFALQYQNSGKYLQWA